MSRAALLSGVARYQSALQANRDRRGVGGPAALSDNGCFFNHLRRITARTLRGCSLPRILLRRPAFLELFFGSAHSLRQQSCRRRQPDLEGLFPPVDPAALRRDLTDPRLRRRLCHSAGHDALLWDRSGHRGRDPAAISVARVHDGACLRPLAFGGEHQVSRCCVRDPVSDAVLALCDAGGATESSAKRVRAGFLSFDYRGVPFMITHRSMFRKFRWLTWD